MSSTHSPSLNHNPSTASITSDTSVFSQLQPTITSVITGSLLFALILHLILSWIDYPILSIPELLWNAFVWLMPSRLVYALKPGSNTAKRDSSALAGAERSDSSTEHATKSGVLRDLFRLNGGSKILSSTASSRAPAGLGNWDNSCYQNSVLQSLASVRSLRAFFDRLQQRDVPLSDDTTLVALQQIVGSLNDESNRGHRIWTPAKLKSMSSWQQQDAQEYFSKIMDQLEKDTVAALKDGLQEDIDTGMASLSLSDSEISAHAEKMERFRKHRMGCLVKHGESAAEASRLHQLTSPLEGLLAQRVGCTRCGYVEGLSLIPFNCLTLPIGKQWNYDLADCLNEYTNLEVIEGVECAKCTLLQARHQLRKHTEDLAVASDDDEASTEQRLETEKLQTLLDARLEAVTEALQEEHFSESTLKNKCMIGPRQRVSSNKTRQAMIMRTPQCLVLHVNRSLFDETTGAQLKNYADVSYEGALDISPWCVGKQMKLKIDTEITPTEEWEMDPNKSMASSSEFLQRNSSLSSGRHFKLSAIITHYGRHENGHYICYRKLPPTVKPSTDMQGHAKEDAEGKEQAGAESAKLTADDEQWWRLSDEEVSSVTEEEALAQGGVFMLFYERVEADVVDTPSQKPDVLAEVMTASAAADTAEASVTDAASESRTDLESDIEELRARDEAKAAVKVEVEGPIKENAKPRLPVAVPAATSSATSTNKAVRAISPTEQQSPHPPQAVKRISPTTMRTAGISKQSAEDMDPFKGPFMVATT